jgi:hypothetical protein
MKKKKTTTMKSMTIHTVIHTHTRTLFHFLIVVVIFVFVVVVVNVFVVFVTFVIVLVTLVVLIIVFFVFVVVFFLCRRSIAANALACSGRPMAATPSPPPARQEGIASLEAGLSARAIN